MDAPATLGVSHQEYQALYEKLLLASRLFEERDQVAQSKLSLLQHRCVEYAGIIKAQRSARRIFEQDVQQLMESASQLEARNQEHLAQNRTLQHEVKVQSEENASLLTALSKQKIRLEQSYVPRDDYQEVLERAEKLQSRLDANTIPLDEHVHLKGVLQQLVEEKRLVEEASRFFDEERHATALAVKEAEAHCGVFKSRCDSVEIELKDSLVRQDALVGEIALLRDELSAAQGEKYEMTQRIIVLEGEKATLLTQLGGLKIAKRSEELARRNEESERRSLRSENSSLKARGVELERQVVEIERASDLERQHLKELGESERNLLRSQLDEMRTERDKIMRALGEAELRATTQAVQATQREEQLDQRATMREEQLNAALAELDDFRRQLMSDPLLCCEPDEDDPVGGVSEGVELFKHHGISGTPIVARRGNSSLGESRPNSRNSLGGHQILPSSDSPPETSAPRAPLALTPHPSSKEVRLVAAMAPADGCGV